MKENWEHGAVNQEPDAGSLKAIAKAALPEAGSIVLERTGTGLSNHVYRIEADGHRYALRLYREGDVVARKEAAIGKLLSGAVPVPEVLAYDWSGAIGGTVWSLMEWMPGQLLRDELRSCSTEAKLEWHHAAGHSLSAIHAFTFPTGGFLDGSLNVSQPLVMDGANWSGFLGSCLDEGGAARLLDPADASRLRSFITPHAPLLDQHMLPAVLVHSDYNALNLLGSESSGRRRLTAVLDWEFAYAGSPLSDVGNWLRYEPRGSDAEAAFAAGYREGGGRLPAEWRELSLLEDLVALCDMLSRSGEHAPIRTADLKKLVGFTMDRFEDASPAESE